MEKKRGRETNLERGFLPRYTKATFVFSGRCWRNPGGEGLRSKIAADEVL